VLFEKIKALAEVNSEIIERIKEKKRKSNCRILLFCTNNKYVSHRFE